MDTLSRVKPVAHVTSAVGELLNAWSFIFTSAVFHSVVMGNMFSLIVLTVVDIRTKLVVSGVTTCSVIR